MKKSLLAIPAVLSAFALTFAGCAKPPADTPPSQDSSPTVADSGSVEDKKEDFRACMVSDQGGFDDKSFNETSYAGLTKAVADLKVESSQIESNAPGDFAKNIQAMVDTKCDIIVTVGFMLSDATAAAAKQNPDIKFAIVDNTPKGSGDLPNLKPLVFNTAQSSFLAGYTAAAMTQTGKVGTFGGAKIPTVTIFMDGFAQGVDYYNKQKGKQVQVIGWNAEKQDGQFTGDFEDVAKGQTTAQNQINQGADIIFPVAGPVGVGALQAVKATNGKVSAIWVDTDGYVSNPNYKDIILTSVYKGMDVAVFDSIKAAKDGNFNADPYVGTLDNDGTGISEFHDFDSKVPAELKTELDQLKADIVAGKIEITSVSQPK